MGTHGLKSDSKHPYMKRCHPFWRYAPQGMYSEEVKDYFERKKAEFEANSKYVQWIQK